MLLRKINAIISLLTTLFLLCHAISASLWMLSKGNVAQSAPFAPWILAGLMAIHAIICIYFAVSAHREGEQRKVKSYPRMNRVTIFQRASGMLLIVFTALHIAGASGVMQPPKIIHMLTPPLFFTIALVHAAVSTDRALISLGIGTAGFIKAVRIIMCVICVATLIAALVGFYVYAW